MGSALLTVAVGFVSGVLSGQFGLGGGFLTTPAIRLLLGYPALIAVGTPLVVILPTALTGAWSYSRRGLIDARAGLIIGGAGIVPSVAGAYLTKIVGGRLVLLLTAVLILYVAADMIVHTVRIAGQPHPSETLEQHLPAGRLVAIGLVTGLYSGFLGLGGGFVVVPALTRLLGMPIKRALGTSLLVVTILAVPGSIAHYLLGHIDLTLAGWFVLGSVPGALLGAKLTAITKERLVTLGFAVVLAGAAVLLAVNEVAGKL